MPYNKLSLNTTKQRRRRVVKKMRTTIVILCLNKKEQRKSPCIRRRRVKIEYNVWYNLMNVVALLSVIHIVSVSLHAWMGLINMKLKRDITILPLHYELSTLFHHRIVAKKSNVVQLMLFDLLIMFSSITIIFDAAMS